LENVFRVERKVERKFMATSRFTTHNYKYGSVITLNIPQPTRLTPQQLEKKNTKRALLEL